ncbi:MAG: CocE/NonD family hydrolase [Rhodobacteraceae bacterium]|nr:CocE/NonD family hydrolase [Paracoccaceae bacterium]
MQVIEHSWIKLPDQRRLAARFWIPTGDGPFPAILEYLPYRKRDGTAPRDETTHRVFAEAGYACVRVDIAGTGDSDGQFDDEYSEQELSDGEDVLTWIAAQDWCDGNIGMIGISWGGFNGLQLAYRRPPALKAVVSVASTVDRYADDIHYMGGCLLSDNVNWSSQMFAYQTRPLDPALRPDWREEWVRRLESTPFSGAQWLRHQTRDATCKHGSVCEDWSAIQIPVLAITGWADAYVNAPPAIVANIEGPSKAMIGPWEHRYAHISKLEASDFHSEVVGWFDRWLKDEQNGAEDLPDYRVFMQEHFNPQKENKPRQGKWIAEKKWPSNSVGPQSLFLDQTSLNQRPGTGIVIVSNPADLGLAGGYFTPGMRIDNELAGDQTRDDAHSSCFDTAALEEPLELLGRPTLKLSFSTDQPVAQIMVRLCDVSPDGVSQRITYRSLNLTHHSSHEHPEALLPGQVYSASIELNECAHLLRAGNVLRLALSTSYWPIVWPAPEPTEISVHLEQSELILPVRNAADEYPPSNPGPAQEFPNPNTETLRQASSKSEHSTRSDGTVILTTSDDFGKGRDQSHGLIVGSGVKMLYAIHPDDPTSAKFETQWNFTFERDGWQVEIDTTGRMTSDAENFYLHRSLRATEGAEKSTVLSKEWSETIPRGLL